MLNRTVLLGYFQRYDRGWLFSLFAVVGIVYLPFFGNPFVFDDLPFFLGGAAASYGRSWFHFDLRWLPYTSLGWTANIFSDAVPHLFHLGNALLHAANVILLFYFLRQLTGAALPKHANSSGVIWGAWLGALIFACHPVAVYAVGYVVQRSILMATFFGLLMHWAYVRGVLSGEKRWLVLSVVSYFAACFSKEHSALLPLIVAALALLLRDNNKLEKKVLWLTWSAYAFVFVLVVLRAKGVFGSPYEAMAAHLFEQQGVVESTPMLHFLSVMTQAGLFFKYLFLWILPNSAWMSIDMREQFIPVWTAWQGWLGIIAFLAYGGLGLGLLLRGGGKGLLGFAMLYPWLLFLLEFSTIRVQEPFVLYRSYLWMPGMMLLFSLLLARMPGRRTVRVLGVGVLLMIPLSWNRLGVFSDNYRLWNDAALLLPSEKVSGADRIFYNRGQAERREQRWDDATADFQRVVALRPDLAPARYELGMAFLNLGRYQEALVQFDAGISISPESGQQYFGKGLTLFRMHETVPAQQQMSKACELGEQAACMMAGWMKGGK